MDAQKSDSGGISLTEALKSEYQAIVFLPTLQSHLLATNFNSKWEKLRSLKNEEDKREKDTSKVKNVLERKLA